MLKVHLICFISNALIFDFFDFRWTSDDHKEEKLYFLDINSSYAHVCSTFEFPAGKCEVLIDEFLKEKNITFDGNVLRTSKKPLFGLIKAYILPNPNFPPFFSLKFESKTFYVLCKECLKKKSKKICNHSEMQRAFTVSTTTSAMNFALKHNYVKILYYLEIFDFEYQGKIFQKFTNILLNLQQNELKDDKMAIKFIKNGLQGAFGKFSSNCNKQKQVLCRNFHDLNSILLKSSSKVTNIELISDDLCDVTYDDRHFHNNHRKNNISLIIGNFIVWGGRILLESKIMKINDTFHNVKLKMMNTDSVIFSMPAYYNLSEKITISNEIGQWKNQIQNSCEITHFYSLNPVCYNVSYISNDGSRCQVNKICGFNFQCVSSKIEAKDFEVLLSKAIEDEYFGIEVEQFRTYKKMDLKKKVVFTLRNTLDQKRIILPSFQTLPYGYKTLPCE